MGKKRFISLVCCLILAVSVLTGCSGEEKETNVTPTAAPTAEEETTPTAEPVKDADESEQKVSEPVAEASKEPVEPVALNIGDYLSSDEKWEDDGGDYRIKDNVLEFNNAYYGDFCAVRLNESVQNVKVQYNVQFNDIAKDLSVDEGTWWDAEFLCLVRSNFAGSSFVEGIDGQAGYCITSWGDMSEFALGRSGYDDVFGTYKWSLNDGKEHSVEFTVTNNKENTLVFLTVAVDGEVIATAVDDGSQVKKERVSFFPDAGGITLRCKYLGAEIKAFGKVTAESDEPVADTGSKTITLADYYNAADVWEVNGEGCSVNADGISFATVGSGESAAVRLAEKVQNGEYRFNLQFTQLAPVSMDDWTWWDSEFLCLFRSSLADKGFTDGQTGYSITSWGDMSTFFLGRSGYDDAFGEFEWPMGDGQPHDFVVTLQNNDSNTAVTITVEIDGTVVATVTDDGSLVKEDRVSLFPDEGGLTFRCLYLGAEVK